MANLASVSTLTGRGAGLLTAMYEIVPLLQVAEFKLDTLTHFVLPDKAAFTGTSARALNGALQRDAQGGTPTARSLALYGREISLDDAFIADQRAGVSLDGLRFMFDRKLRALAVKLAEEVETDMFTGTDASNRCLGISEFVKDAAAGGQTAKLGFTADEQAAMNTQVSLQINTAANQDAFVEILEKEMAKVPGANAIVCNPNLKARLTTIARRLGAAGETRNNFGTPLATFNGVPIYPVSTSTITSTESDGTNNDNTSLYILRFAEDGGVSFVTNSGFKFDDIELDSVKPNQIARLQIFFNLSVEKTNALRRLSRIRL